jgi:hypothetical protein
VTKRETAFMDAAIWWIVFMPFALSAIWATVVFWLPALVIRAICRRVSHAS